MLGAELTALRVARQLDRSELAKNSGISVSDIRALEQGRFGGFKDPDYLAGMLLRLCDVFEVDSITLTQRIFRLMTDPGNPDSEPGNIPPTSALRARYFYAGLFAFALIIPFAGLWWLVTT